MELCELLKNNPYPGRGIALGRSADDRRAVMVYFIMGRSPTVSVPGPLTRAR